MRCKTDSGLESLIQLHQTFFSFLEHEFCIFYHNFTIQLSVITLAKFSAPLCFRYVSFLMLSNHICPNIDFFLLLVSFFKLIIFFYINFLSIIISFFLHWINQFLNSFIPSISFYDIDCVLICILLTLGLPLFKKLLYSHLKEDKQRQTF